MGIPISSTAPILSMNTDRSGQIQTEHLEGLPGVINRLSNQPLRWAVPDSGLDDGFFATGYSHGQRWFTATSLKSKEMMLIQTADSSREGGHVWRDLDGPYWRVYSAE